MWHKRGMFANDHTAEYNVLKKKRNHLYGAIRIKKKLSRTAL